MKILLINPPIREWAVPNCVPLGLAYIASVLRERGHEIEVLDINAFRYTKEEVEDRLKDMQYDLVGMGGLITTAKYIKWLSETIKLIRPEVKIILGGAVSTSAPEIMLNNTKVDIACIGEGEITAVELVDALNNKTDLRKVAGIYCKGDKKEIIKNKARKPITDLDSLPLPAYDLFPMDIYVNNPVGAVNRNKWADGKTEDSSVPKSININATRGCPYRCIFCYHDFMGAGYRHHSTEYILKEMKFLNKHYGVTYFLWADDESVINRKFVDDFCELMKGEKTGFEFSLSGRVNLVDRDMLSNLKEAGCNMVGYGIESGSPKMLKIMKKNVTVEQAKDAIRLTREVFGDAGGTFVIGLPGETDQTIKETIQFCKDIDLVPEAIFFATAYPGTELYDYAISENLIKDEFEYICRLWEQGEQILINFTDWTDEELSEIREGMIKELKAWNVKRHAKKEIAA